MREFRKPEYGITNRCILFSLDDEDIDEVPPFLFCVLQRVAAGCRCFAVCCRIREWGHWCRTPLSLLWIRERVATCCNRLQVCCRCVAGVLQVFCSVLQDDEDIDEVLLSLLCVLQLVAAGCGVLQVFSNVLQDQMMCTLTKCSSNCNTMQSTCNTPQPAAKCCHTLLNPQGTPRTALRMLYWLLL